MVRVLFSVILALVCATPAIACDCMRLDPAFVRFEADLDRIAEYYPVAAEGVLEANGPYAWKFRPSRELRGPGQGSYAIDLISDCSLGPNEIKPLLGRPVFLLLSGGPERYEVSRCVNLQSPEVEKAIRRRIGEGCKR